LAILAAFLLAVGVGAADELTQSFAPIRTSDFADLRADVLGAIAGALLGGMVFNNRRITGQEEGDDTE
jgi:VanZ family protein